MDELSMATLRRQNKEFLAFLIASARGLIDEPVTYGPLRMADAACRFVNLLDKREMSNDELNGLASKLRDLVATMSSQEEMRAAFDDLLVLLIDDSSVSG